MKRATSRTNINRIEAWFGSQTGIGRAFYEAFFELARRVNRTIVCCVMLPVNQRSIAFHRAMGFAMKPSETTIDGLQYYQDYDGPAKIELYL